MNTVKFLIGLDRGMAMKFYGHENPLMGEDGKVRPSRYRNLSASIGIDWTEMDILIEAILTGRVPLKKRSKQASCGTRPGRYTTHAETISTPRKFDIENIPKPPPLKKHSKQKPRSAGMATNKPAPHNALQKTPQAKKHKSKPGRRRKD